MTKKDYILIADALRSSMPDELSSRRTTRLDQWKKQVAIFIDVLKSDNPRFPEQRFVDYITK